MTELIAELKNILGGNGVLTAGDDLGAYRVDWSGEQPRRPAAVLRPATTAQLSAVLKLCHAHRQPLVVQGGMTGLAGGATPRESEIAISLQRMAGIEELDQDTMTMTVLAGTPLQTVQDAAADAGLQFPLDLGARGSCQIGGNVATNAGGNGVIRYGMTRALVLGLEVVLADGTIVSSMNKMLKNNAGYDLKQLFIGSEGTLGVISRIVLRLFPGQQGAHTALCATGEFGDVVKLLHTMQAATAGLNAFEVMWSNYYRASIAGVTGTTDPFRGEHAYYVLLECDSAGGAADEEQFEQLLAQQLETGVLKDAVIARSMKDAELFWRIRDGVGELITDVDGLANFDVSLPLSRMEKFVDRVTIRLNRRYPGLRLMMFGHLGDGNIHILASTGNARDVETIYREVYEIIAKFDGSVSAEHGIGVTRKQYLRLSRGEAEITLMKTLKQALDPRGILNPGRVI